MQYEIALDGEDAERITDAVGEAIYEANAILAKDHDFPHELGAYADTLFFEPVFQDGVVTGERASVWLGLFWGDSSGTILDCVGRSLRDALARVTPNTIVRAVLDEIAAEARRMPTPEELERKARREAAERANIARITTKRRAFA